MSTLKAVELPSRVHSYCVFNIDDDNTLHQPAPRLLPGSRAASHPRAALWKKTFVKFNTSSIQRILPGLLARY
ncbi:hypothetical protein CVT26_003371 [Gymnopilus dilepis]|uniref:Uncharacterized protein n=1 Tax=Gymnopilus dilepis TaxID=231916 RepID=A0A409VQK2_9AGAR|nr:hypothetical protein CVT26_003371 [Gymnopilus dilepis]